MKKLFIFLALLLSYSGVFAQASTVGPLHGGTGVSNPAVNTIALGEGSSNFTFLANPGTGRMLISNAGDPSWSVTPSLGVSATTAGTLTFFGGTSGSCIIQTAAVAGTSTKFQLPATNGSNTNVLQTDGTGITSWVAAGAGTVTSVSVVTANGVSGTVATPTTTPAITLTLGAITPTTVVASSTGQFTKIGINQAPDATATLAATQTAFGVTSTDGYILQNTTAAAVGAQQWSPRIHLIGQGWKTNATAASQTADWIFENQPIQGAANPTSNLVFSSQINALGYNNVFSLSSAGVATHTQNAIGATSTDGIVVQNTTAAVVGAQQFSPRIHLSGQGWKTNATAATQAVDEMNELRPVQGAANPTGTLAWAFSINGGAYVDELLLTSAQSLV